MSASSISYDILSTSSEDLTWNFTNGTQDFQLPAIKFNVAKWWTQIMFPTYGILIFFCNILTITAVWKSKELHTPTNMFILSLAFGDFLNAGPLMLATTLRRITSDTAVHILSPLIIFFNVYSLNVSLYNILLIGIDRYRAVAHPLDYRANSSISKSLMIIVIVWLLGGISPAVFAAYAFQAPAQLLRITQASIVFVPYMVYIVLVEVQASGLLIAAIALYSIIFYKLRNRLQKVGDLHAGVEDKHIAKMNKETRQYTKIMMLVLSPIVITWIPFNVISLAVSGPELANSLVLTVIYMANMTVFQANSFINTFIYAWLNPKFRQAYIRIFDMGLKRTSQSQNTTEMVD